MSFNAPYCWFDSQTPSRRTAMRQPCVSQPITVVMAASVKTEPIAVSIGLAGTEMAFQPAWSSITKSPRSTTSKLYSKNTSFSSCVRRLDLDLVFALRDRRGPVDEAVSVRLFELVVDLDVVELNAVQRYRRAFIELDQDERSRLFRGATVAPAAGRRRRLPSETTAHGRVQTPPKLSPSC